LYIIKISEKKHYLYMSRQSTLHPSPHSLETYKESSLADIATHSLSFLGPSDSWRYKSDSQNFPEKKSFTDYAIVHRTQRSTTSEQTMPSNRFDPNEIENNIVTVQRPIHLTRGDFSFAKQRSNNFSDKAVESVQKTIDAFGGPGAEDVNTGTNTPQEFNVEEANQDHAEDKSLEMYMNQMLDVSQKVEVEADKTIETYFSNTMDVTEKIKLETANLKAKYMSTLDGEFKPSRLFCITEKLSTVMRNMRNMKDEEEKTPVFVAEAKFETETEESQETLEIKKVEEPKRTTVNLMDLIIEYTKNPNIEQKVRMTKRSFLKRNKANIIDKENQPGPEDSCIILDTSQALSVSKNSSSQMRQTRKEKNFVQLNKSVKETLSSSTKRQGGSQERNRSISKERTPGKLSMSQLRSKSGERNPSKNRLNQSAIENSSTLMTSHMRSTSCQRRGSLASGASSNMAFLSEIGVNCNMFRKDEESVIMTLKETMQKLLDKTEANREQIRVLKLSQGDKAVTLEVNKSKANYYKQKTITGSFGTNLGQRRSSMQMQSSLQKTLLQNDQKAKNQNQIHDYNSYNILEARNRELEKILSEKTQELDKFQQIIQNLQQEGPKIGQALKNTQIQNQYYSQPQSRKNENQYEKWRSILNEKNY